MALSMGEQVRWWSAGFAVFILFLWAMSDVLMPFLAGAALAYFLDPVVDRLQTRGFGRTAATAIVTLLMVALFVGVLVLVVPAVITEARDLVAQLPAYGAAIEAYFDARLPQELDPESPFGRALNDFKTGVSDWSVRALQGAWTSGLAVIDFLTLLVITPVVAFYLLLDWDRMVTMIDGWIPRDHVGTVRMLASGVDEVLAGFVRGQMTVCGILGVFYAAALTVVGLQFGLAIGLFAGLISFIPFVGSILGGAFSIGVALFQFWNDPVMIVIVAAIFFIGQAVEGNFLTPKLVGGSVGLHPVALMFALSAFGSWLGFTGLLIAVPTAAAIGVLGRFALEQYQGGRLYTGLAGRLEAESRVEYLVAEAFPPDTEAAASAGSAAAPAEPSSDPAPPGTGGAWPSRKTRS
ncbi:MAG: AI-2E family transporter [Pseudomonadota bacterium]